ncbi:MAG: hypothetical protein ACFFBP_14020 [Promethearchaeota archaeon]
MKLKIKDNLYLIIPIITTTLWMLYCFWFFREDIMRSGYYHSDLLSYHVIGYNAIFDPSKNYPGQWYMPISGYFFFITFTIWPIPVAHWISIGLNYIFAILLLFEFNKILKLMEIEEKVHRFLFLIIPANGWIIFWQFQTNSHKFLTGFIILFILRREILWNKEEREKDLIYYIINYGLFLFILGWMPYLVYFLIIYIFYNIPIREILKKEHLKKYLILFLLFIIQNFYYIINPYAFYIFLTVGLGRPSHHGYFFLLYTRLELPAETMLLISNILVTILFIICFLITFIRSLTIQQKFTYFSIFYILLGTFRVYYSTVFLWPLIMLSFVPFLKQENISIEFIKKNFYIMVGLLSFFIYNVSPTTGYGGTLAMILIGILISCIIIIHIKDREEKYLYLFLIMFIIFWTIFTILMFYWFYLDYVPEYLV